MIGRVIWPNHNFREVNTIDSIVTKKMSDIEYELFLPEEEKDDRALLSEFLFEHFLDEFPLTKMMPEGSFPEEITKPLTWLYVDHAATMLGTQ